jgi:hypothetical protein
MVIQSVSSLDVVLTIKKFNCPSSLGSKQADYSETMYIEASGVFELIEDRRRRSFGTYGLFPLNDMSCELRKMYFPPSLALSVSIEDVSHS